MCLQKVTDVADEKNLRGLQPPSDDTADDDTADTDGIYIFLAAVRQ